MASDTVQYYFAFRSPFAALADFRIDYMIENAGARLEAIPIVPPDFTSGEGIEATLAEWKLDYLFEDAARCARKVAVPWNPPSERNVNTEDAVAGYYYAVKHGQGRNFRNAIFRSRWCEGKDISSQEVLADCAEDCRLSRNEFLQALRTKLFHSRLDEGIQRCMENQVFGVPTFIYRGKRFWGNDRLDQLIDEIRSPS